MNFFICSCCHSSISNDGHRDCSSTSVFRSRPSPTKAQIRKGSVMQCHRVTSPMKRMTYRLLMSTFVAWGVPCGFGVVMLRRTLSVLLILALTSITSSILDGVHAALVETKASIVYTAVVRGRVALPCNIIPPNRDDEVALVLWYKDNIPAPIFTIDARETRELESARQTAIEDLTKRAVFNMANKPAFLQLDPVTEADGGEYRCRVDFKRARSINTVINLRVIVPPGEPIIVTEEGKPLRGLIGPFNEGDPLTLACRADIGKPRPTLKWLQEGSVIDDSFSFDHVEERNNIVRNSLEIPKLTRAHLLAVLSCQAANNNITAPSQTSVTLDINLKPLDINIQPPEKTLSAGNTVELVCTSSGSRPPAVLSWWKGDEQVKATKEDFAKGGLSTSTSVFVLVPKADDDGKMIACRADNPAISGSALERSWTLDVHYKPRISLVLGANLRESDIQEGRDVYLECKIRANPRASEVTWELEGTELQTDKNKGIIVSSSSLVLQSIQRFQRGWYTCSASNREGATISNRLQLKVKYAPRCREQQRRVYGVDLHETTQIRCDLDADPDSEIEYTWAFNNSQGKRAELNPLNSTPHRSSRSILNYKPITEQDYGELLCYGSNAVGHQLVPCVYHIVAAGSPDPPENCTQVNATENGFTVECVWPDTAWNGGVTLAQLSFLAEVINEDTHVHVFNVTTEPGLLPPTIVIRDLEMAENNQAGFRVQIYARNHKGHRSNPVVMIAHVLNASKYQTHPPGRLGLVVIRPVIGVALGLVFTAVFVGLVGFTVIKCKRYQEEHKVSTQQQQQDQHKDNTKKKSVTQLKADASSVGGLGPLGNAGDLNCSDSLFDLNRAPDIIQQQPANTGHRGLAGDTMDLKQLGKIKSAEHPRQVISTNSPDFTTHEDGECGLFYTTSTGGLIGGGVKRGAASAHSTELSLTDPVVSPGYGGFSVGGAGDLSHESAAELLADTCGTLRRSGNGTSHNQHSNNTSSRAHRIPQSAVDLYATLRTQQRSQRKPGLLQLSNVEEICSLTNGSLGGAPRLLPGGGGGGGFGGVGHGVHSDPPPPPSNSSLLDQHFRHVKTGLTSGAIVSPTSHSRQISSYQQQQTQPHPEQHQQQLHHHSTLISAPPSSGAQAKSTPGSMSSVPGMTSMISPMISPSSVGIGVGLNGGINSSNSTVSSVTLALSSTTSGTDVVPPLSQQQPGDEISFLSTLQKRKRVAQQQHQSNNQTSTSLLQLQEDNAVSATAAAAAAAAAAAVGTVGTYNSSRESCV
ncbi:uncharacterized protein LOC111250378 isoform X2 [Varroa destructor]|uniref:Ig-like domain-containing protein n=1 Tax=Varroa destructor TaxID=109461 RepID=A0A7M7MA73_VARDE|nr:uncharacterized protein LOC111250378 isoform X2 [Varroa destructor]